MAALLCDNILQILLDYRYGHRANRRPVINSANLFCFFLSAVIIAENWTEQVSIIHRVVDTMSFISWSNVYVYIRARQLNAYLFIPTRLQPSEYYLFAQITIVSFDDGLI